MNISLKSVCFVFLASGLAWLAGCRGRPAITPPVKPLPPKEKIARTGYTVQVGAFTILDNARRLTEALSHKGLNTYYFRHESGLYKVRFGDFSSKEAAVKEAERLFGESVIEDYYIVKPEDYAVTKRDLFGEHYLRDSIVATAESYIGVEYSWGGTSKKKGFDCSGLTMAVYQMNGLNMPRSSRDQYNAGIPVSRGQMKKGDLVFFKTSQGQKISHVGIYAGNQEFIHAPGKDKKIRKDSLVSGYYRNRFVGARTYLE